MAKQKTATTNNEQVVESTNNTVLVTEKDVVTASITPTVKAEEPEVKELTLVSAKNIPLYKIATRQKNIQCGTLVAGHHYPYKGKTQNPEGVFYYTGKGYVYADECIKIQ